jgi:hypothetical protein
VRVCDENVMKLERPVTIKNPKRAWVLSRAAGAGPRLMFQRFTITNLEFAF